MFKPAYILLIFCLCSLATYSQFSNRHVKTCVLSSDSLVLDTLSIVPESILVQYPNGSLADTLCYRLNLPGKTLIFKRNLLKSDSLRITYRCFPFDFEREVFRKNPKELQRDMSIASNPYTISYGNNQAIPSFYQNDGLTKNGSVSRGISFGNNQDVVVNSNMNLQVTGKLTNNIHVVLAATDNNIPVQPDGNTQQLQEFDKVYIQLNDDHTKLTVGDFQISRPAGYFMNFYKRTQGLMINNSYVPDAPLKKEPVFTTCFSAAVSRGRFARNVIQGIENNQGPYRLRGADNELFIIVLSGTEKVYIDGKLLQRGQENDYTIDYNSAELSFTARQLITKDRRIVVEFQYAERNYARSLYFLSEEYKNGKLGINFNFYSEQDNKNKTLQQGLSKEQKQKLVAIGDTLTAAVTDGALIAEYNTTEVFYKRKDTVAVSGTFRIYQYALHPDTAYRVKFSYVGEGRGNYRQVQNAANGRVYAWLEPLAGVKRGNYEPVVILVTPKKKQMATLGASYVFSANQQLNAEAVYTVNDLNTFSPHNTQDDNGTGFKLNYTGKSKLPVYRKSSDSASAQTNPMQLHYGTSYEYVQRNFSQVERFRGVEFTRDWNRNSDSIKGDQHLYQLTLGLEKPRIFNSLYQLSGFNEGSLYRGFKNGVNNAFSWKQSRAFYNASFLNSSLQERKTEFYRHKSMASQGIRKVTLGYLDEKENNYFYYHNKDSLLRSSYSFWEWETNLSNTDTTGNRFKLFYRERVDSRAAHNRIKEEAKARSVGFTAELNTISNHSLRTSIIYRKLNITDSTLTSNKPDNTLLSRIEYAPRFFRGFLQSSFFYETGFGLEPRREYSFIQVAPGQGQYTWKDYNGNGIKELNEFEIAVYNDQAIFIKVYTPTGNYIKAGNHQLSASIFIRPAVFRKEEAKWLNDAVSRFAFQTAMRIDKKSVGDGDIWANPLIMRFNDSLLLSANYNFRQAVFFNQNSPVAGFDYTFQHNIGKQLLTNGYETRTLQTHELRLRWNITSSWAFMAVTSLGEKINLSQFFNSRNYQLQYVEWEPKISFQPNTAFRINVLYKNMQKRNIAEGGFQVAEHHDYALEWRYNQLAKGSFNLRADYIDIRYNDTENSAIAFEMLNALRPGRNITWNLSYQHNLSNNIQISITYDGRKPPATPIINIGGAQVRAFF